MPCSHPITVQTPHGLIQVRCKQCLQCRIWKQNSLTLRGLLESHLSTSAEFWTMTYETAPETGDWTDFSKFLKRLRAQNRRDGNPTPIRFIGCGEYGTRSGRFHYHGLIFNSLPYAETKTVTSLWPHGHSLIGDVTPASTRYVLSYTLKFMQDPSKLPVYGKSERPPLGANCMQQLGARNANAGTNLTQCPTFLKWENKTYPLDLPMQVAFAEGYKPEWVTRNKDGSKKLSSAAAPSNALRDRREVLLFGDPFKDQRISAERKSYHQQRSKHYNGKL